MIEIIRRIDERQTVLEIKKEFNLGEEFYESFKLLLKKCDSKILELSEMIEKKTKENNNLNKKLDILTLNKKDYKFLQRNIIQRKKYLSLINEINNYKTDIKLNSVDIDYLRKELDKLKIVLDVTKRKQTEFLSKKTLDEFGFTYEMAAKVINDLDENIILKEEDVYNVFNTDNMEFSSLDSLVFIHKTKDQPKNSKILTKYDKTFKSKDSNSNFILNGKEYKYQKVSGDDNIHFSLNGIMEDKKDLSKKQPYVVFIPFKDINKENLYEITVNDSFTSGAHILNENTVILCPFHRCKKVLNDNPKLKKSHVIGYEGNLTPELVAFVVSNVMGCKPQKFVKNSWENNLDALKLKELLKEKEFSSKQYINTVHYIDEGARELALRWFAIIKILREEKLITNEQQLSYIYNELRLHLQEFDFYTIDSSFFRLLFKKYLNEKLKFAKLPRYEEVSIEDLNKLGITDTNDIRKNLFRNCFSDIYKPLINSTGETSKVLEKNLI